MGVLESLADSGGQMGNKLSGNRSKWVLGINYFILISYFISSFSKLFNRNFPIFFLDFVISSPFF